MVFETSWDDGSKFDIKLVALLDKYKIPAVLYIPIHCEVGLEWVKDISKRYEIGGHTVTHPLDLKKLSLDFLEFEIISAKEMMEIVVGKPVTKFCYPRGRYDDNVAGVVKRAGYTEGRTTKVLADKIWDKFKKPTTVHVFQRSEYEGRDWYDVAVEYFDRALTGNSYFHLWGHSWEVEKNGQWDKLEKFFKYAHTHIK